MHTFNDVVNAIAGGAVFFAGWYLIEKFWPKGK